MDEKKSIEEYEKEILELAKRRGQLNVLPEEVRESLINEITETQRRYEKLDPHAFDWIKDIIKEDTNKEQESTVEQNITNSDSNKKQDCVVDNSYGGFKFELPSFGLKYEENVFNKITFSLEKKLSTMTYTINDFNFFYDEPEQSGSMNIQFINGRKANVYCYQNRKDNLSKMKITSGESSDNKSTIAIQLDLESKKQIIKIQQNVNGKQIEKEYISDDGGKTYIDKSNTKKQGLLSRFRRNPKQLSRSKIIGELNSVIKVPNDFDIFRLEKELEARGRTIEDKFGRDIEQRYLTSILEYTNDFKEKMNLIVNKVCDRAEFEKANQIKIKQPDIKEQKQVDKHKNSFPKKSEMIYDD